MTILRFVGRVLFSIGWVTADLAVASYDAITHRDPDAELKRFLADRSEVRWYYPDGERGGPT